MRVRLLFLANLLLAVVTPASFATAQSNQLSARFNGTVVPADSSNSSNIIQPLTVTAAPTPKVITFNAAAVGIPVASAQTLTASFLVSGYTGTFTPTATLHYGHDYTLGAVKCVVSGTTETCTVPITFLPTLPGARKDALLLMDGTTTLSTVLLGGTGQAPLGLIQPGVVTSPISGTTYYIYQSTVDENGTVYFLSDNSNAVYSYTKAGVLTQLPITGLSSPHAIAIDGAGTLYIAQNTYSKDIITYSAAGVQGSIQVTPPSPYVPCANSNSGTLEYLYSVAVDQSGNLFALELLCNEIFELKASGTYSTFAINPVMTQPSQITADAAGNLFIGGYAINELTAGGVQTEINTVGAGDGLSADAADTLYATRYTGLGGVAELPPSGYSTALTNLDPTSSPLGMSTASDGTMYVGNYTALDKVDRSQGAIAFGEQTAGVASTAQDVSIYNGGNKPLTVSSFTIAGTGFLLGTASTNNCTAGLSLAPGAYCSVAVTMKAAHAGTFSGTVTFTSNSLNASSKAQTVALSGFVYGVYVVPTPGSLVFAPQLAGTTSAPLAMKLTNQGDLYAAAIGTPVSSNPAFTVSMGTCSAAVAAGASCNLTVTFNPTAAQTYTGTVTVSYSSSGGGVAPPPATFSVSGGGAGTATLTPASLSFASTAIGSTSATQVATLKNTGTVALTLPSGGITLTGANPTSFLETTTCGTTLAPAATCTISVSFKPLLAGALTATLNVADSTVGSPQKIILSGSGTAANVTASLTPASMVFSATLLGSTSAAQIATLKNTGSATLSIPSGGITITGTGATSFLHTTTCGATLAPAATCTITLNLKPLSPGALTATLNVADNAAGSPQKIALSGTGIAIPTLTFTPASLIFPNTAAGATSIAQTVVVKNAGTVAITLSSVSLTGTNPTSFEQLNACGPTLAAGATCTVFVAFKPASAAVLKANLTLTDTAAGSPQNVAINGTGTAAPVVHLSATSLVFASTAVGSTSPSQSVTITNSGTSTLNVAAIALSGTDAASFAQLNTCGPSLAPAASCIVNIALKSVKAGSLSATLTVTDNGAASPQSVALTGTGH